MGNLLVYKASAGSGKTYKLALEYIKLALAEGSPIAYRHILAVTFTNKATTEMKDRILFHLFNLAEGGRDQGFLNDLLQLLNAHATETSSTSGAPLTAKEVCTRAKVLLQNILHDYDHFRVETIDSFFQSLLTNLAHELGLTRNFRTELNDKDIISRAVDQLITDLEKEESRAVKDGLNEVVWQYMREYMERGDGWNITKELKAFALKNLFNLSYLVHEDELNQKLAETDLYNRLHKAQEDIEKPLKSEVQLKANEFSSFLDALQDGEKTFSYGKDLFSFAKEMQAGHFQTKPGKRLSNFMKDSSTLVKKKDEMKKDVCEKASQASALLSTLNQARERYCRAKFTRQLMQETLGPLRLLREIDTQVNEINKANGHFMLAKTPILLSRMVGKDDASFVFEKAGTTFHHIMIDEFQDTSSLQWDNLYHLLVENLAQGNECMLVGDIKQSIYRWRGGDWRILENVKDNTAFQHSRQLQLPKNFRSKSQIVAFNNAFFPEAAKLLDSTQASNADFPEMWKCKTQEIYAEVTQEVPADEEGGFVRVKLHATNTKKEEIYEDLHEQINRLHVETGIPFCEMAILVRRNIEGTNLIDYFAREHPSIPITSDEAFRLTSSPAVMCLIEALRILFDPKDKTARIRLLQILEFIHLGHNPSDLTKLVQNEKSILPDEFFTQRELLLTMPLYTVCEHLIALFGLCEENEQEECTKHLENNEKKNTLYGQSAYLFKFQDSVLEFLNEKPSDLKLFLDYWDTTLSKASTTGKGNDGIQVITIHKAKGLGKHTVLIPFCDWDIVKVFSDDYLWCRTPDKPPYNDLPITAIRTRSAEKVKASAFNYSYIEEKQRQQIDNLNLLYVAFTRAKENLLVWARPLTKDSQKESLNKVGKLLQKIVPTYLKLRLPDSDRSPKKESFPEAEAQDSNTQEAILPEIYTLGEPTLYEKKNHVEDKEQFANPFADIPEELLLTSLTPQPAHVEFKQSSQASEFIFSALNEEKNSAKEKQETYIDKGKLLHFLFSKIRTENDVEDVLHDFTTRGLLTNKKEEESLRKFIYDRLAAPLPKSWFDGSWQLFNECNIIFRDSSGTLRHCRPDRVMTRQGETIVVDFKFGKEREEYIHQVRSYMDFLAQMGYTHPKGFLWYVYSGEVMEVLL